MRRGRRAFVWESRVVPIGIPLGLIAGVIAWRRTRHRVITAGAFAGVVAGSFAAALLEFERSRRLYRSVHGLDIERTHRQRG